MIKYIAYLILFTVSFLIFLYWVFPYDSLKDRIISGVERQLGGGIEVNAGELEPYWFTGVEIDKLEFSMRGSDGKMQPALTLDKLRVRAALLSLIIGSPRLTYLVEAGKGEIEGKAKYGDDGIDFDADFDNFNVSVIKMLSSKLGLNLSGKIDGYVSMKIDSRRPSRSSGKVAVDLIDFKMGASEVKLGPMDLPLPPLVITKSRGSGITFNMNKGAVQVEKLAFKDGDLGLDVTGKIFLSNRLANSRFNIKGSFRASEALEKALPFLFVVEKEKAADGTYPLTITGRLSSPTIKIGTFTLPL